MPTLRGLYAIVDTDALARRGLAPVAFAEAVLAARPGAIQLRDKRGGARRAVALLREIAPMAARAGVPLFANDRSDVAALARCDGVHLGQDDVPVRAAQAFSEACGAGLRVGLSTHDRAQLEAALEEPVDYVAIGPVFATASKERPDPVVGLDRLAALRALAGRARPEMAVVAIGGITRENAADVGAICGCGAVIGALLPGEEPRGAEALDEVSARARALHEALLGAGAS